MWRSALLIRPDIVIMLGVGRNHSDEFRTLEVTAREKARLLERLPRGGLAILNGDDPRVRAMAVPARARVHYFGTSPSQDTWAAEVSAQWPERLRCQVRSASETQEVQTRLVGAHWVRSIVAAMAAAKFCGVGFGHSASILAGLETYTARMEPEPLPSGAVLLRDEFNGSFETFLPALNVLRTARAARRVLVTSGCLDAGPDEAAALRRLLEQARDAADLLVLVDSTGVSPREIALRAGLPPDRVRQAGSVHQAAEFLRQELRGGDVVLLKGPHAHHLSRVWFGLQREVRCATAICWKRQLCDSCPDLFGSSAGR
jgi:UDP-N-acetylmuramoyl-tripeptide--D-alanyl-D-alanine ligase